MEPLELPGYAVRRATAEDLSAIVALLADDELGSQRETADLDEYKTAFEEVTGDQQQVLVVAVTDDGRVAGTLQLTFIPGLSRRGARRALVEGVRVGAGHRGAGLGTALIRWSIAESRRRGCALVQLTSDKRRTDAHRFYQQLGFTDSHVGFKLAL